MREITDCPHRDEPHWARGMCRTCYYKWMYKHNPKYRESVKARVKRAQDKKRRKDPEWNARRQRKFREKHPDKFNFIMARYYLKKLSPENRIKAVKEVEK
jgi:hypothetical protein